MGVLLRRELDVIARPAFVAAVCVHVAVLALFVFGWTSGRGVTPLAPRSIYEQLRLIQFALLVVVLPWTACRTVAEERGRDLLLLAALSAVAPSRFISARSCALSLAMALIAVSGLPVMLLVFRMAPADLGVFVRDEATVVAMAIAAAAVALACRELIHSRLGAWVSATALCGVLAFVASGTPIPSATIVTIAIGVLAALVVRASAQPYLPESRA